MRGAETVTSQLSGNIMPADYCHGSAIDAVIDIAAALGLETRDYLYTLEEEREGILERFKTLLKEENHGQEA